MKMQIEHVRGAFKTFGAPTIPWNEGVNREVDGEMIIGRPTQGYGDCDFTYAGKTLSPLPWASEPTINLMKEGLEMALGVTFDHCLAGLYADETIGIPFHKDVIEGKGDIIASVSLGAPRDFLVRNNESGAIRTIHLLHGDLVIMDYASQQLTEHAVPAGKEAGPRINLTFRTKGRP